MPTILVVDSDHQFATDLGRTLETKGHVVVIAGDSRAALDAAARIRPDVILLDARVREMNCFDVCKALKRNAALKSTAVMLIGDNDDAAVFEHHQKLRYRADAYLHK